MAEYYIQWEIYLDGETPEEACRKAAEIMQDKESAAVCFTATNCETLKTTQVDLLEEESDEGW